MSPIVHAFVLLLAQTTSAFDRADRLFQLSSTSGFSSKVTVNLQGLGTAKGTYDFRSPNLQRFRLKGLTLDEEFLQNSEASVHFDHLAREYTWYPALRAVEETPPEANPLLRFGLPSQLTVRGLASLAPKTKWVSRGKDMVNGRTTEAIAVPTAPGTPDALTLWIDPAGVIVKLRHYVAFESETRQCDIEFESPTRKAKPAPFFNTQLPYGYTPSQIVRHHEARISTEEVSLGKLRRLDGQAAVELRGKVVLLITSMDLADESDPVPWRDLASQTKRAGATFAQVWIGSKPARSAGAWDVYYDEDGRIERLLGPPVTPYVMALDNGVYVGGWQGTPGDDNSEMVKSVLKPFLRSSR